MVTPTTMMARYTVIPKKTWTISLASATACDARSASVNRFRASPVLIMADITRAAKSMRGGGASEKRSVALQRVPRDPGVHAAAHDAADAETSASIVEIDATGGVGDILRNAALPQQDGGGH